MEALGSTPGASSLFWTMVLAGRTAMWAFVEVCFVVSVALSGCSDASYDAAKSTELMCTSMPHEEDLDLVGSYYSKAGQDDLLQRDYVFTSVFAFKAPGAYGKLIEDIETRLCTDRAVDTCGCWAKGNGVYRYIVSDHRREQGFFFDAELSEEHKLLTIREVFWR
ncbi:MAG: hypothetical protein KA175_08570 [Flavobacteriales bacterium]|nr:hypothetical protein [Flavobacteriales bacterium]